MPNALERLALAIDTHRRHGYGTPAERTPLEELRAELEHNGLELARAVDELLGFVPGEVSPVVLQRDRFAHVQAALDGYVDAGNALAEGLEASDDPD